MHMARVAVSYEEHLEEGTRGLGVLGAIRGVERFNIGGFGDVDED